MGADNLTLEKLAATIEALKPEVHYIADEHCQKIDEDGNPAFFHLSALNVFVLHPDNLSLLSRHCRPIKYQFAEVEITPIAPRLLGLFCDGNDNKL